MTTFTAFLAPNPKWQGRDATGAPIQNGKLYTYVNGTTTPKATYLDPEQHNANTNPVILDAAGEADIYWLYDDTLYTIVLYDEDNNLVYSQDNYPVTDSTNTQNITTETPTNLVRNAQFTYWTNSPLCNGFTSSANNYDFVADDWLFTRNNTSAMVNITREAFSLGQTDVPSNPQYYLKYSDSGGSSENTKYISQQYTSVQTLSGQQVSVSFYARSDDPRILLVTLDQYFGTGGSPSSTVETNVKNISALTTTWTQYTSTVTLPSVSGKNIGTNNNDNLQLRFNLPQNQSSVIYLADIQMQIGDEILPYPYLTVDDQNKNINALVSYATFKTGDTKLTARSLLNYNGDPAQNDPGWLYMNDGTIGDPTSGATTAAFYTKALYSVLWNNVHSTIWLPIFDSAGVVTTYGSSAELDFNAHKRLSLTKALGRILAGAGQSVIAKVFTADSGTDKLAVDNAAIYYLGSPVTVANSGGALPNPLAPATTYYVIPEDSTHIKLASTQADAIAGSAINITTNGTGTNTIILTGTSRALGEFVGSETSSNILSHTHAAGTLSSTSQTIYASGGSGNFFGVGDGSIPEGNIAIPITQGATASTGSGTSFSILDPQTFMNVMIKL